MPGLPYEMRIIFAQEFRRQIRNKGLMFFTALILIIMVGAIPVTPIIVGLFEDAQEEASPQEIGEGISIPSGGDMRYGYVDPLRHPACRVALGFATGTVCQQG